MFLTYTQTSIYKKLPIKIFIHKGSNKSHTAIILNPGAFETAWGDNNRYKYILEWLQKNLAFHPTVVGYQTSRNMPDIQLKNEQKADYWRRIFVGKTFQQEFDDVKKVYRFISQDRSIGVKTIYTLGFSVGGTFGLALTSFFPHIKKVCVMGSAISTKRAYFPVLSGYPPKKWFIDKIKKYKHDLKICQGFEEKIVPVEDAETIFSAAMKVQSVSLTRIAGADHMFSGRNKYGLIADKTILSDLKNFFEMTT